MKINNLQHLETVPENELIVGGVAVAVGSSAEASGDSTYTSTTAYTTAQETPGADVAIGSGFAYAEGDTTATDVQVSGSGDIVAGHTTSTPEKAPIDMSRGQVVAVDLP